MDEPSASRLKWRAIGSLIVFLPCLIYAMVAYRHGNSAMGGLALCGGATAILLYLLSVCVVFVDDFLEMGIVPIFILSLLFVIFCPVMERVWQRSHSAPSTVMQASNR